MRYPLTWYHDFGRESICFLVGHRWRSSWRKVREVEPEGWASHRRGNPYWEFVSHWHYKCLRCRVRTHGDAYAPWWIEIGRMVSAGWRALGSAFDCYRDVPFPARVAWVLLGTPAFALEQVWYGWFVFEWSWPALPGRVASAVHIRLSDWLEKQ